eukprot:TRINITY_DN22943_c0_g1_i1.p1 TRINITY_DN22943_c0_g1~~TRINITY_DN22943_c0_g1_i1.p1  ORF type:complete len:1112 (+),score=274.54 TRINITY_DN22943_c0_g1_i1:410-3337(+)
MAVPTAATAPAAPPAVAASGGGGKAFVASSADLDDFDLEAVEVGVLGTPARRRLRADLKMEELEAVPGGLDDVRVLGLTGNRLRDLDSLRGCTMLEELSVCQQAHGALTNLAGIEGCSRLVLLRATQNALRDTDALSKLVALRHVELSKNNLSRVRLNAPGLARLDLYRNELTSLEFAEHLPSLTYLDVGRNRLTHVDANISEWCPLLLRLRLHENRIRRLPSLTLPLLTELGVDNNELEALGPLGFLPSLERLSAAHNRIEHLSQPIAASPLLHMLTVAFNRLASAEAMQPVFLHGRLRKLQLGDNPAVAEMMEKYRPWVLKQAPQLEELDNDVVSADDRLRAAAARAAACPRFAAFDVPAASLFGVTLASLTSCSEAHASQQREQEQHQEGKLRRSASACGNRGGRGLLSLVEPSAASVAASAGDVDGALDACGSGALGDAHGPTGGALRSSGICELPDARAALAIQRTALLARWRAGCRAGGCPWCSLALWCEAAAAERGAALVLHNKQERQAAAPPRPLAGDAGRGEVLYVLRRRADFWRTFLDRCASQHARWRDGVARCCRGDAESAGSGAVWQVFSFEDKSTDRAAIRLAVLLQGVWRGVLARKRLETSGVSLPGTKRRQLRHGAATRLQASIRGSRVRRRLRAAREASRALADVLDEECPEVDVDAILGSKALDFQEPLLSLEVPDAGAAFGALRAAATSAWQPSLALPPRAPAACSTAAGPREAWNTPPGTACQQTATFAPMSAGIAAAEVASPASSRAGTANGGLGRCRSLSSTAESAVLESEGLLLRQDLGSGGAALDRIKSEWGFESDASAQAYLAAQKRMKYGAKPPKPPSKAFGGAASTRTSGLAAATPTRSSSHGPRSGGGLHGQQPRQSSGGPGGAGGSRGGSLVKAQDAIAAARQQLLQQQADASAAAEAPPAREFRSGEPNKLLLRSSRSQLPQTPPHGPPASPRAGSPHRRGSGLFR